MKIGLCAWSYTGAHREAGRPLDPHRPLDLARLAAGYGLKSVECAPGPLMEASAEERRAFRAFLEENDLDLFLDTGGHDYAQDITPLRRTLEAARQLGALAVRTTISRLLEGDRRPLGAAGWKAHLDALIPAFKEIVPLAEQWGIPIGIENHQDLCSWELVDFCRQVGSPLLGVTMDVGNALAVGETPEAFARRVLPHLKHVHLKDYTVHPTPSGYRLVRCPLGEGVVDWPSMLALFDAGAPQVQGCIELGASQARHIRLLEEDYWSTYPPRPLEEAIAAIRTLHRAARPPEEEWRTPHERKQSAEARAAYEQEQMQRSLAYVKEHLCRTASSS